MDELLFVTDNNQGASDFHLNLGKHSKKCCKLYSLSREKSKVWRKSADNNEARKLIMIFLSPLVNHAQESL